MRPPNVTANTRPTLVDAELKRNLPAAVAPLARLKVEKAVAEGGLIGLRNLSAELTPEKLAAARGGRRAEV